MNDLPCDSEHSEMDVWHGPQDAPVVGLRALLTPEQRTRSLSYKGDESFGDVLPHRTSVANGAFILAFSIALWGVLALVTTGIVLAAIALIGTPS